MKLIQRKYEIEEEELLTKIDLGCGAEIEEIEHNNYTGKWEITIKNDG